MINKYNQYIKESLLDKITGPSKEELLKNSPTEVFLIGLKDLDYDLMTIAIEHGADLNRKTDAYLPLRKAISNNDFKLLNFILDNGFKIKYSHFNLLFYMNDINKIETCMKLFIENVDTRTVKDYTYFYNFFIMLSDSEHDMNISEIKKNIIEKILLFIKYDMFIQEDIIKTFPLIIKYGIYELIDVFIKNGANIDKYKKLEKKFNKYVSLTDISLTIKELLKYA